MDINASTQPSADRIGGLSIFFTPGAGETQAIWDTVVARLEPATLGEDTTTVRPRKCEPAGVLIQLIRRERPTLVVAHSLGGVLALQAARANPHIVGLILVSTAARLPIGLELSRLLRDDVTAGLGVIAHGAAPRGASASVQADLRRRFLAMASEVGPAAVQADFAAVESAGTPWPAAVAAPASVIVSSRDDRLVPWTLSCALAISLQAPLRLLEDGGHLLPWTQPDAVADAIQHVLRCYRTEE